MARKTHDDALGVTGAETIIGSGVTVHGELNSESDVMIDGHVDGNITTTGDITIGVNAEVTATLTGANIMIAGHLTGNIHASSEANIKETGRVDGDITSIGLSISSGGIFIGRSRMKTTEIRPASSKNPEPDIKGP
jgi:cytoskeletal protein CcmA (bactofilin family)